MSSMRLVGEHQFTCSCQRAWEALRSPEVLRACITGCESVEALAADKFGLAMVVAIGPVKARFKGSLRLLEERPPHETTIKFEGNGGVAGLGSGEARVRLVEGDHGCTLYYEAKASAGGRLAQIGSRLIEAAAHQLSRDFFERLSSHLEPTAGDSQDQLRNLPAPAPSEDHGNARYGGPLLWVLAALLGGLVVLGLLRWGG